MLEKGLFFELFLPLKNAPNLGGKGAFAGH